MPKVIWPNGHREATEPLISAVWLSHRNRCYLSSRGFRPISGRLPPRVCPGADFRRVSSFSGVIFIPWEHTEVGNETDVGWVLGKFKVLVQESYVNSMSPSLEPIHRGLSLSWNILFLHPVMGYMNSLARQQQKNLTFNHRFLLFHAWFWLILAPLDQISLLNYGRIGSILCKEFQDCLNRYNQQRGSWRSYTHIILSNCGWLETQFL